MLTIESPDENGLTHLRISLNAEQIAALVGGNGYAKQSDAVDQEVILKRVADMLSRQTAELLASLGNKNENLKQSVEELRICKERQQIMVLLSAIVAQSNDIRSAVQAGHNKMVQAQTSLDEIRRDLSETKELMVNDATDKDYGNARALANLLNESIGRSSALNKGFCISMIELEHYANLHDQHGSEIFAELLEHMVSVMKGALRESDRVFLLEGGIFILTVPDTTLRGALLVLSRIRTLMASSPYRRGKLTISLPFHVGLAEMQEGEQGPDMIKRARKALQQAKSGGQQ